MSGKIQRYEASEKRNISKVRVEYYLISHSGIGKLSVVGNKDRKGRARYLVARDFLEAFGSNSTINAYTKWTKNSEVRKWIASFVKDDDLSLINLDHQGDSLRINEENKVVQHAPVDVESLNYAATGSMRLALPARSLEHLYESKDTRGRKRKSE